MYEFTHLPKVQRVGMIGNRIAQLEADILSRQITLTELAATTTDPGEFPRLAQIHEVEIASLVQRIDALRAMLKQHEAGPAGPASPREGHHEHAHV